MDIEVNYYELLWYKIFPYTSIPCEIILVHNHPSGDVTPSDADERVIYEMIESGRMMKIPMRDFVIIGKGYFSHYETRWA
jgi:DNA repair protein RadC